MDQMPQPATKILRMQYKLIQDEKQHMQVGFFLEKCHVYAYALAVMTRCVRRVPSESGTGYQESLVSLVESLSTAWYLHFQICVQPHCDIVSGKK
jgi:hypothetical protein